MNVYDFDGTIFYPNCLVLFNKYCMLRHPRVFFHISYKLFFHGIRYALGLGSISKVVTVLCSVTRYLDKPDEDIKEFWDKYEDRIAKWYLDQKQETDLIISASPEYLIKPIADKLGVKCVATVVDVQYGVMVGNLNMAKEKAKYIIDKDMPLIDNFYSDSLSDTPIALLSENAFMVKNRCNEVVPWPHLSKKIKKKIFKKLEL